MIPQRINAKLFAQIPTTVELQQLIPIFQRWIRNSLLNGVLIDVIDYKHVHNGPGIILIGHEGDYSIDLTHGRLGLMYRHKRAWQTDNTAERLQTVLYSLLQAAHLLVTEKQLDISFYTHEIELTFPDRLNVPNKSTTFALLENDVRQAVAHLYPNVVVSLTACTNDQRQPFTIQTRVESEPPLASLTERTTAVATRQHNT